MSFDYIDQTDAPFRKTGAVKLHGEDGFVGMRRAGHLAAATLDFIEQHLVINGASDLLHKIFEGDDGHHARSAIGFAQLPTGVAVEIEAIFEIK